MKALGKKEGWRYNMGSSDWDNSVTQYGVLGIWAAKRAGFDPGDEFWQRMSKHFRTRQNKDGGWGYQTSRSTANMATAGLATMFLGPVIGVLGAVGLASMGSLMGRHWYAGSIGFSTSIRFATSD